MMSPSRIFFFLLANALGFFTVSAVFYGAYFMDKLPKGASGTAAPEFQSLFFGGSMWLWLLGMTISLGYLFTTIRNRNLFLLAPVVIPALYQMLLLIRYSQV